MLATGSVLLLIYLLLMIPCQSTDEPVRLAGVNPFV